MNKNKIINWQKFLMEKVLGKEKHEMKKINKWFLLISKMIAIFYGWKEEKEKINIKPFILLLI